MLAAVEPVRGCPPGAVAAVSHIVALNEEATAADVAHDRTITSREHAHLIEVVSLCGEEYQEQEYPLA